MSDYVPLEEDIGVAGWNQRVHNGPLSFSATIFSEEVKADMRQHAERLRLHARTEQHLFSLFPKPDEESAFLHRQFKKLWEIAKLESPDYDVVQLAELIAREMGI